LPDIFKDPGRIYETRNTPSETRTTKHITFGMTNQERNQLITACCRGDARAQRTLFERHKNPLFTVCLRYARDRPEAQDILQEAFLAIFRDLGQYNGSGPFEGWLRKVTVRAALQHLRRSNVLRFAENYDDLPRDAWQELPDEELAHASVLHIVQQLPAGYRTVFNMRCVEAWSYEEIAAELGIVESSVRSRYTRACRMLRQAVEGYLRNAAPIT